MAVDLGTAVGQIIIDSKGAVQGIAQAETMMGKMSAAAKVAGVAIGAGMLAAGGALIKLGVEAGKSAANMEQSMANIAATMGKSRDEIAPLGDLIKNLAVNPNLKVSATEAADAVAMLARNGLDMTTIMEGAAEATVYLANATGGTFSQSADIMTDTMAIFGIEAANAIEAVNGITSVTTNSKFSIDDYALALAQGGGAAAAAGVEFDDFNTAMAAISPLFASGSDAGTSFKVMMQRLSAPTDEATALMKQLGIQAYDSGGNLLSVAEISASLNQALMGTSTAMVEVGGRTAAQNAELERLQGIFSKAAQAASDYEAGLKGAGLSEEARAKKIAELNLQMTNAQAVMQPLLGITGEMTEVTRQLTEEERASALATIFGSDAMRAAAGLMESGAIAYETAAEAAAALGVSIDQVTQFAEGGITQYEALMISMGQTDAMDAAATRMDTFAGTMDIVKGLVEGLVLQLGEALLPFMRQMADALLDIAEKAVPVVDAISSFIEKIVEGKDPFQAFQSFLVQLGQALGLSRIEALRLALRVTEIKDSLVLAWDTITGILQPITDLVTEFVSWKDVLIVLGGVLAAIIIPAILSIVGGLLALAAPIIAAIAVVALLRTAWEENWGGIQEKTQAVIDFIVPLVNNAIESIKAWWAENGDGILAKVSEIWEAIKGAIETAVSTVVEFVTTKIAELKAWWAQNGDEILAKANEIWEAVKTSISTAVEFIETTVTNALDAIKGWWNEHGEAVKTIVFGLWEHAKNQFETNLALLKLAVTGVLDGIKAFWEEHKDAILAVVEALWTLIETTFENGKDIVTGIIEALAALMNEDWEKLKEELLGIAEAIWEEVKAIFTAAITIIGTIVKEIVVAVKSPFETFDWGQIGNWIIDGAAAALSNGAGRLAQAARDAAQAAWDAATSFWQTGSPSKRAYDLYTWVTEGGVNAVVDGTASLVKAMEGMGGAAFDAASEAVASLGKALAGLDPVLAFIEKLRGFDTSGGVESVFSWLNHQLVLMAEAIRAGAARFGGMVDETTNYAKMLGDVVGALSEGAGIIGTLREVDTSTNVEPMVLWLNGQVLKMAQAVRAGAVAFGTLIDETKAYASLAKDVIGVFAEGIGAIGSIQEFVPVADIGQRVAVFSDQLVIVFSEMAIALNEAGQRLGDALQNAASMSDFIIDIVKMLKPAVDGLVAILGFVNVPGLREFARSFATDVVAVMEEIVTAFTSATTLTAEGLAQAADMASNVTAIAKMVDPLTDGEKGAFVEMMGWVNRGAVNLPETARLFTADLIAVTTEIVNALTNSSLATGLALDKAGRMSENLKELFVSIKKATIAMSEMMDIGDLSPVVSTVRSFAAVFLEIAQIVVTTVGDAVAALGEGAISLAERTSRSFSQIVISLRGAIDQLSGLSDVVIDTTKIETLLNQLPTIAGFIQRILGLVNFDQVSANFIQWVSSFGGIILKLNEAFISLEKIAAIELDTAPIFKNLGALPFIAQRLANTLGLISKTQADPQSAVNWIKSAVEGIKEALNQLKELANAEIPGGIGDIINAIQLQINLLPDIFQNAAVLAVNNLVTILANAVPQVQQIAMAMGAVITNEMVRGVIAGQSLVNEAFSQVATGGRSPLPPVTNNNSTTTNNYFGGQTYSGGAAGGDAFAQLGLIR